MGHFISHLLVIAVLLLLAKSVRRAAERRMTGFEGRIATLVRLLPIVPLTFFSIFAVHALQDPDLEDRIAGGFVLVCAALLFIVLVHYWTYRLVINDERIIVQSLVMPDRIIHFTFPYDLFVPTEQNHFKLKQNGQVIQVYWIVSGYTEILAAVVARAVAAQGR